MNEIKEKQQKGIKVGVIISKCSKFKELFGIRIENLESNNWVCNWAFKIKEDVAKREGYDNNKITGNFFIKFRVPGMPILR
jgi:hypothetical protein